MPETHVRVPGEPYTLCGKHPNFVILTVGTAEKPTCTKCQQAQERKRAA